MSQIFQIDATVREARSVWRRWRRRPLLPAVALAVLVLGAGAGAATMTFTYALLIQPLPYPNAGDLVIVRTDFPGMKLTGMGLSGAEAVELPTLTRSFAAVGFGYVDSATAQVADVPERVDVARVSADLLEALRVTPRAGRVFSAAEDVPSGPDLVLLSESFWMRHFAGDPRAVGRSIQIDGRAVPIAGVLPARVDLAGRPVDLWTNLRYDVASPTSNRANHIFTVVARRRPGVSDAALSADIREATDTWMVKTGQFHAPESRFHPLSMTPLDEAVRGRVRPLVAALTLGVLLVVGASIANVATLLAADAEGRRAEFAIRAALGASRARLWHASLVEAGLLALLTSALAPAVAVAAGRLVAATAPESIAIATVAVPLWPLAIVSGAIALIAALAYSVVFVWQLTPGSLTAALGADGRAGTAARYRARRGFIALELALAAVLVASAGQLVETVWRLSRVDLGFRPSGVLTASISLPGARYSERARIDQWYGALADRLRPTPGVTAVGFMSGPIPERRANNSSFAFEGQQQNLHTGIPPVQFLQFSSPGFFDAVGITLLRGRLFTDQDATIGQPVAILNERAARAFFPARDAIGARLRPFGSNLPWMTVVGVVADARQNGLTRDAGTEVFVPLAQAGNAMGDVMSRDLRLVVRMTDGNPMTLAPVVREAVRALDPAAALSEVTTLSDVVNRTVSSSRFLMAVLVAFALLALVLAAATVYGMVASLVTAATREIGVRRSLGAPHGAIARLVLGQVAWLSLAGAAVGLILAQAGARWLAPFVFQAPVASPWRLAAAAGVLAAAALIASAAPLLRALRIDPAHALRHS